MGVAQLLAMQFTFFTPTAVSIRANSSFYGQEPKQGLSALTSSRQLSIEKKSVINRH